MARILGRDGNIRTIIVGFVEEDAKKPMCSGFVYLLRVPIPASFHIPCVIWKRRAVTLPGDRKLIGECVKSLGGICMKVPGSSASAMCPVSKLTAAICVCDRVFYTFAKITAPSPLRQKPCRPSISVERKHLVTVLGELLPDLAVDGCALLGVNELLLESTLALVVGGALDLSPLLEPEELLVSMPSFLAVPDSKRTCQRRRCTSSRTHGRDGRRSSTCGRA